MEEVEDAEGEAFAAGGDDEDEGFDVPEAEEVGDVPGGSDGGVDLGPEGVAEGLPGGGAFEADGFEEARIGGAGGAGDDAPAEGGVSGEVCEEDDGDALVYGAEAGAIEYPDEGDAEEDARHEEGDPKEGFEGEAPGEE